MKRILGATASVAVIVASLVVWTMKESRPVQAQESRVEMDLGSQAFRLNLGEGESEETDWAGEVRVRGARVIGPSRWSVRSQRAARKTGRLRLVEPAEASFVIAGGGTAQVTTPQGAFSFRPDEVGYGRSHTFLDGRVTLRREPLRTTLTAGGPDEDFPSCARASDDSLWCAYVAYDRGSPVDPEATAKGEFASLVPKNNGDQIRLMRFSKGAWTSAGEVTASGLDVWRPSVAIGGQGGQIVWSQQVDGNWDLYARGFDPQSGGFGEIRRLTESAGADINAVAATDSQGRVWVAWQGWRDGKFDIWLAEPGASSKPLRVSTAAANDWNPSIAAGPAGDLWVAWDTYDKGDYDVYARHIAPGRNSEPVAVAASARFEARASIAVDARGRPWIAYEDAAESWGKDSGDRWPGRQGVPFYQDRYIRVRMIAGDQVFETKGRFRTELAETYHDDPMRPTELQHRVAMPRIAFDKAGRLWLFFRRHPLRSGLGEIWAGYATYYEGEEWASQIDLPASTNLIDNRPSLCALGEGVMAVYSTDKREVNVGDAKDNDLMASFLVLRGSPDPAVMAEVDPAGYTRPMMPIHPNEKLDVGRMRAHRISLGGKSYRYLRGEFHRHTEISSHRDWDGPLEEVWRYGLDVASMDWIGPGDHDYGRENDYLWWLTQKQEDIYHHAGAFLPMFTYERSQVYPSGHRNVMFSRRGIRPLPRLSGKEAQFGTFDGGSDDVKNLYRYLREFGGICSSHTSATNMGTDWRDADEELEPVVEIFQGHRLSYEETNAPLAPRGPDDAIQGYRPLGFVWEAFKRGRKLGFQSSSDHVSTHISYGIVLAEEATREGIIDAFKKRHSYAANDNILLEVRSGEHLMGDEFLTHTLPRLDVAIIGTTAVERVDIVRQIEGEAPAYIAAFEPRSSEVKLSWVDNSARQGKTHLYYVRVMQENKAMAWASPMWIRYEPE